MKRNYSVIVDKISMVSTALSQLFANIHNNNIAFGNIIVAGDLAQLPSAGKHKYFILQYGTYSTLYFSVNHGDIIFIKYLKKYHGMK